MARILIVGGGCRGLSLASSLREDGHTLRITTRERGHAAAIEATGAECWIADAARLATLRGALEHVSVACWMLATASGTDEELAALHGPRLEFFMTQVIDSTVRGVLYERAGTVPAHLLEAGAQIARALAARNAIPLAELEADPHEPAEWVRGAREAIGGLLRS